MKWKSGHYKSAHVHSKSTFSASIKLSVQLKGRFRWYLKWIDWLYSRKFDYTGKLCLLRAWNGISCIESFKKKRRQTYL